MTPPGFIPLGGRPTLFLQTQVLSRLAGPVFMPLGEVSNNAAWRPTLFLQTQVLSRLAGPVFMPLGEVSNNAAWRPTLFLQTQVLSRLAAGVTPRRLLSAG